MRILIVEDDFVSRLVLQKMLSPLGESKLAVNGREAVEEFETALKEGEPFDLICLDIMMPEMDGRETLRRVRQIENENNIHPKNEVKILMVSALDTPDEVIDAYYQGGCSAYIVKPIDKDKLNSILNELGLVN